MSGYRNGSELEGLGFKLCVAPPRVVMSLISKYKVQVGDDFIVKDKSWTRTMRRRFQVVGQEEDLRE